MLLFLIAMAIQIPGQPGRLPPWVAKHGTTAQRFYLKPDAAKGVVWLDDAMAKENLSHPFFLRPGSGPHARNLIAAQIGDVATGNAKVVRQYETRFQNASDDGKRFLIRVLHVCGDAETSRQVDLWMQDEGNATIKADLVALQKTLAAPDRKHYRETPVRQPGDIDKLWGNFYITGEYEPIAKILDVFDQQTAPEVLTRVGEWSMRSNARRHTKLRKLLADHVEERPKGSKALIQKLLNEMKPKFPLAVLTAAPQSTWSLKFEAPNSYSVRVNGETKVEGTFVVQDDQLTLTDIRGPLATTVEEQKTGVYRWSMDGATLRLKTIKDESKGRMLLLTTNRWLLKP